MEFLDGGTIKQRRLRRPASSSRQLRKQPRLAASTAAVELSQDETYLVEVKRGFVIKGDEAEAWWVSK
jgi:hypothetical protein